MVCNQSSWHDIVLTNARIKLKRFFNFFIADFCKFFWGIFPGGLHAGRKFSGNRPEPQRDSIFFDRVRLLPNPRDLET